MHEAEWMVSIWILSSQHLLGKRLPFWLKVLAPVEDQLVTMEELLISIFLIYVTVCMHLSWSSEQKCDSSHLVLPF